MASEIQSSNPDGGKLLVKVALIGLERVSVISFELAEPEVKINPKLNANLYMLFPADNFKILI
ncbi:hypothetical protein DXH95_00395 [Sphingorhabdus pulchriflava]|uniref:Uncharacterized protein n=1 Tax=Sphingorhabdus pulchriflava TaxID=2292257 RepID=A0A371BEX0_9SPHN|nr:hypothetical protein DXH95_00395 [Sphingorhabdus pulchriflava]